MTTAAFFSTIQVQSCTHCGGAITSDNDELLCLNCGRITYPNPPDYSLALYHTNGRKRRDPFAQMLRAQAGKDDRWKAANREVINLLRQGINPSKIARIVGKDVRQVRDIKSTLESINLGV